MADVPVDRGQRGGRQPPAPVNRAKQPSLAILAEAGTNTGAQNCSHSVSRSRHGELQFVMAKGVSGRRHPCIEPDTTGTQIIRGTN